MSDAYIRDIIECAGVDTNHEGLSYNVFFSGCSKEPKCKNCHNPELWEQCVADKVSVHSVHQFIKQAADDGLITHIVFMGGEPLDQCDALVSIATYAKSYGLHTWLYSGKTFSNIPIEIRDVMDVVVAGEFIHELRTGGFPGSSNQEVIRR